ncbi:MAG: S8 family peptidase [Candidatus Scalindua rubra]|uniref:Peptidase S8/S53 domain-containing protein n=1 Tax=Candidatus Scalindua brodae TaxID=237368 RepID=A0A0B0ESJ3_9BACT|nr:MAG: hypothetical protein SCABRO_00597 [Candidatus Scalindua brodae]MBZ0110369.1 S8 family peptidase [Candidatus Scalindua rubra]TWU33954.1 hypothetical protein S225a_12110 [Candidatus Brocadiaceae bacterium S225]
MPTEKRPHIVIRNGKKKYSYTPRGRVMGFIPDTPVYDQGVHSAELHRAYNESIERLELQYEMMGIDPSTVDKGATIELKFRSDASVDVATLENQLSKIELLNVKLDERGKPQSAIIYIPPKKQDIISNQISDYGNPEKNKFGKPRNFKKYDKTETFETATIEKLWIDKSELPADRERPFTWEVWLRKDSFEACKKKLENFDGVTVSDHKLNFPEREICSVHCSLNNLDRIHLITKAISGFRYLPTLSGFFDALPPREQKDWSKDLSSRIVFDLTNVSVCILDTGIITEHPLLKDFVVENGIDTCEPDWGVEDHDGHGTQMAGIALFGDLAPVLETNDPIELNHSLESVKVFPPQGSNKDDHVGYITSQAVSRAEINNVDLKRVFCLSWSMEHEANPNDDPVMEGKPTPLSAKIDQLACGVEDFDEWIINDGKKRLLVVSAGNIRESYEPEQYGDINDLSEVEDPGQSWNALTVGAYTDKTFTNDPNYDEWSPIAKHGDLSAKSRTSVLWGESYWPTKPDIVLEGGNYLANPAKDYMEAHPDTSVLTIDKDRLFSCVHDTSPANAEASRLAATVMAEYPEFWPETVRGLIVHSAEWVDAMNKKQRSKAQKISHLRRYGYGVPQTDFLLNSFSNRPCVIIQDYLKPFGVSTSKSKNIVFCDMNHYVLPWPEEQLKEIYDKQVKLRVTLSFFIEPSPSERPPRTKYSYASHELRFKLKRPNEPEDDFLARINSELQIDESNEESENIKIQIEDQDRWILGPHSRDRGSIISDIWDGTGSELATQNMIAIVPQVGWWKFRSKFPNKENPRYEQQVRYSLILSLITEETIDLYTPIVTKAKIVITV